MEPLRDNPDFQELIRPEPYLANKLAVDANLVCSGGMGSHTSPTDDTLP